VPSSKGEDMLLQELYTKGLIRVPGWLLTNCHYLTMTGSVAYGVSSDTSDMDLYGFCTPKLEMAFPHLNGWIPGFRQMPRLFEQWQEHGIYDSDALAGKGRKYDFTIFSIAKYFDLLTDNNPNIIDSLFTSHECVLHSTQVGEMVREKRTLFLSKKCFEKFKRYAFSQMHKMQSKNPQGKRKEMKEEFGYDVKFGYHLVRLLSECEQILMYADLDLRKNNEHLKAIRKGEVSQQDVMKWATEKERQLEKLYVESKLPENPDENTIKQLLLNCMEHHYGNLKNIVILPEKEKNTLLAIRKLLEDSGI
jgi:predicted nucleotidyltransferase